MEVTLGGERLGSGNKQKIHLRNFERSTHDLSYTWRTTMASGTLVPFMSVLGLPGDTFDIDLDCDVLTHPTIGPLFGSYKIQLDIFQIPIRLYQAQLHMNMLGIGMDMSKVKLPQMIVSANDINRSVPLDNQQINPSCILSYLGIRGIGQRQIPSSTTVFTRAFNALPLLGYWDIFKNYYSNKQETNAYVIHRPLTTADTTVTNTTTVNCQPNITIPNSGSTTTPVYVQTTLATNSQFVVNCTNLTTSLNKNNMFMVYRSIETGLVETINLYKVFKNIVIDDVAQKVYFTNPETSWIGKQQSIVWIFYYPSKYDQSNGNDEPQLAAFPLENIDTMRKNILAAVNQTTPFEITKDTIAPYSYPLNYLWDATAGKFIHGAVQNQEGLAIKTYQSDLFNNWISTEWIDGVNGISAITSISTEDGSFTIDTLNLSKKVYDMLNRIALSGGSYDDWLDAVYTHERTRSAENPMYLGGLIKNLVFQEVVSNSNAETPNGTQPLGTLAGRGKIGQKHQGGKIIAKIDEPSYIMGIVSLTPYIDYSQGNSWDMNLQTMNDLHKPNLDAIGYQDLLTDQMAYWDTLCGANPYAQTKKSAGKQPAWINYMTAVNVTKGNFADQNQQMFMTLNRRYEHKMQGNIVTSGQIQDLTTYIDPSKFNHIFADSRRDAQNFWTQIAVNCIARRKMSAKVIPNL